jgi:hypothetical protein
MLGLCKIVPIVWTVLTSIFSAVLYDFESDITRTFFPPFTKKPEKDKLTDKLKEQLFVNLVKHHKSEDVH